jgi:hypothetical protein
MKYGCHVPFLYQKAGYRIPTTLSCLSETRIPQE